MMYFPVTIYYDSEGHYSEKGNEYEWIRREEIGVKGVTFMKREELTYSLLVDRICRKINIVENPSKLKLSYFPLTLNVQRPSYIDDDEDLYGYLITLDKEQRRSLLHVEVVVNHEMIPFQPFSVEQPHENIGDGDGDDMDYNDVEGTDAESTDVESNDGDSIDAAADIVHDSVNAEIDYALDSFEPSGCVVPSVGQNSQFVEEWGDGLGLVVGQEFESKEAVQLLVEKASHLYCFRVHILNSDTNRYVVKCQEFKKGCSWYLRVARPKNSSYFSVRVYRGVHTCSRASASTSSSRRGTRRLVASILHEDYPGKLKTPTPRDLIGLVQGRFGVEVSYSTAFRGKKQAVTDIRGNPDDCFMMVHSYLHMLEKVNPGTKTSVVVDEEQRFKYLFVALGACIEGFAAMRKVIIVDATFLKTVYGGVLIIATAQDPNHHHYPIAFAVVDGEKDVSWTWFFTTLKTVIPDSPELVFVSDRNSSLIKAITEVYPIANHGYCSFHLSQNVRSKVSNVNKDVVASKFRAIAEIYTEVDFEQQYADFRRRYPSAATYLDGSVDVRKWARCYFPGERYNINTTNSAESINAVFKDVRKYSLLPMIDAIIEKFAEWFNNHRKESVGGSDAQKLVPVVENILHERCISAAKLVVNELNTFQLEYIVDGRDGRTYLLNLKNRSCSCRRFDIDKYPCVHAIAAMRKYLRDDSRATDLRDYFELCSPYYLVDSWALAYTRTIYPVPHMSQWDIPEEIQRLYVLPPHYIKRKGRVQETRIPSVGERRRRRKAVRGRNLGDWFTCGSSNQH